MARRMQGELEDHELPPPAPAASGAVSKSASRAGPPGAAMPKGGFPKAPPLAMPTNDMPEEQRQLLLKRLMQLTPDQIARLDEGAKMQVLQFLQGQSGR